MLGVVDRREVDVDMAQVHGHDREAAPLEAADDLADQAALDRVGLAEEQRAITHRRPTLVRRRQEVSLAVHERVPLMTIFPGDDEGVRDNLKCGFPTKAWVSAALATAGFARHQFVYTPSFRWLKKAAALLTNTPQTGRLIVHAFSN